MSQGLVVRVGAEAPQIERQLTWEREEFHRAGYEYAFVEAEDQRSELVSKANAIICGGGIWDDEALSLLRDCKIFMSCSVGLDWLDLDAATRRGLIVCHMPEICTDEVADHTLALLLACVRKVPMLDRDLRQGGWSRDLLEPMPVLRGKQLGLLGFGRIARAVAVRGQAFGMSVSAFDPYVTPEQAAPHQVTLVDMPALIRESDVISCHLPLTPETEGMVGRDEFRSMKSTAYFLNASRGRLVDEGALVEALTNGHLASAGLDVFEQEPPDPASPLLRLENVVLTPHSAGYSDDSWAEVPAHAVREVMAVLGGGEPSSGGWANRSQLTAGG